MNHLFESYNLKQLDFYSMTEAKLFFLLINNPNGFCRKDICERLNLAWTTAFDNLDKLAHRKVYVINSGGFFNYIETTKLRTANRGRPKTIWFVPTGIRNSFLHINFLNKVQPTINLNF